MVVLTKPYRVDYVVSTKKQEEPRGNRTGDNKKIGAGQLRGVCCTFHGHGRVQIRIKVTWEVRALCSVGLAHSP